jgi:fumarate hydratase subunit beta
MIEITTPLLLETARSLHAGERVAISGVVYSARDAAHARLMTLLDSRQRLPFPLENNLIYYVGPCPPKPGQVIGSAGPTTSSRMDRYTPRLLEQGLRGMIGKGPRSPEVNAALAQYGAVYFGAIGGAGALLAGTIRSQRVIAFADLGTEAIRELVLDHFPALVLADAQGNVFP